MELTHTNLAIGAIAGLVTIVAGMLAVRASILKAMDERIREKADDVIAERLTPVLAELKTVTESLNNGIRDRVLENSRTLDVLDEKVDRSIAGQAEMKGTLRTLTDVLLGSRPAGTGRRSYDPQ